MIPILEPAQFPWILVYALFLTVTLGIPTALVALVIFFMLERVPSSRARLLLPAAGALLMLIIALVCFSTLPESSDDYNRIWIPMMVTGFLQFALVILAPYPFIRRYIPAASPYLVIIFTVFATFFLLACFGFIGGDAQRPPATESGRMIETVIHFIAELLTAALVYAGLAALGTVMNKGTGNGE